MQSAAAHTMLLMLRPTTADERFVTNFITEGIARYRIFFFGLLVLLYAVTFNGQWRIGQDSAIYRGLAANIAAGKGYVFGEWATHQAYPGLPYLLAGVQFLAGADLEARREAGAFVFVDRHLDTVLSVLLIVGMSALTMVLSYRLLRLHYPQWIAVCVTFGMGINSWFLQLSHELLTDIPFLLGVVAALYGWELLKRAQTPREGAVACALLVPGLGLAATMRPMFWVVAAAWTVVCVWAILRGNRRLFHAVSLFVLLVIWAGFILMDPRHSAGLNPFAGGYEREFLEILPDVHKTIGDRLHDALSEQIPPAFFGEQMAPLSVVASVVLLGACLLLFRRHALWGWMVFIAFGVTLIASTESRYYIMILPMMLLAWILMLLLIVRRLSRRAGTVVLGLGLAIVTLNNLSADIGFIREQRSAPFIEEYRHGAYLNILHMSDLIRARVGDDERVLGPLASVMSYVSGRTVLSQREVLPRGGILGYPQDVFDARLNYAVFPASVYRRKEPVIAKLMERNLIYSIKTIGRTDGGWRLGRARIRVPDVPDWRELEKGWIPPPPAPKVKPPKKKPKSAAPAPPAAEPYFLPYPLMQEKDGERLDSGPPLRWAPASRPARPHELRYPLMPEWDGERVDFPYK